MCRDYGDRENSRVRDLVDLVILIEHGLLTHARVAASVRQVWAERDQAEPPTALPELAESWPVRYEQLATEHGLGTQRFNAAEALIRRTWNEIRATSPT